MTCKACGSKTKKLHKGVCFKCIIKQGKKERPLVSKLPKWFTTISNKVLPPLFFLFLAILTLHYISIVGSTPLKINLGIISITSTTISLYLVTLLL